MIEQKTFEKFTGITFGRYRLEQFVEERAGSPVFLARRERGSEKYLLHMLLDPTQLPGKHQEEYFVSFQTRAAQIAALQHPYLLPLVDYGVYRNIPYLVSPQVSMRSLRTRQQKNGPMDIYTAGRYLDQICTVLEYAHQNAVIHESLSMDSIYLRLDGQILVANPGLRSMIEPFRDDSPAQLAGLLGGGYAPEQLLNKPIGPYTDVYSLGVVLYQLLTDSPPFPGNTPEEVAQRHLYASLSPLNQWRNDLPSGIYSIFVRAMGKDPAQRFYQPAALANAYHRLADPNNRTRVPFVINSASTTGYRTASPSASVHITEITESVSDGVRSGQAEPAQPVVMQTPFPTTSSSFSRTDILDQRSMRRTLLQQRFGRKDRRTTAIIAGAIVLVLLLGTIISVPLFSQRNAAASGPVGVVTFFDNQNLPQWTTDSLSVSVQNLSTPQAGYQYDAWLINNDSEQVIPLGALTGNGQSYHLQYLGVDSGGSGEQPGPNLLAPGDKFEITLEQGAVRQPTGNVVLAGTFPPKSFAHITHLLVGFPETPGQVGMLVGLLNQTYLLNVQAAVLTDVAAAKNTTLVQCVAQYMINILEGTHGANYKPLSATCVSRGMQAGDGFGLLGTNTGFLAGTAEHATLAISQPDATQSMRTHAGLLQIALANMKTWDTIIDRDAVQLRNNPSDLAPVSQIAQLSDDAYHGVDTNGDGQIDPVTGEAGALTAFLQGQLMASLSLTS